MPRSIVSLIECVSPRFCTLAGLPVELLGNVPRKDDAREQILSKLRQSASDLLSTTIIPIPAPPSSLNFAASPHTYRIGVDFICFVARALPMRRTQGALLTYMPPGWPEALRLNKDVITQNIARQIAAYQVGLLSVDYGWGWLVIEGIRHYEQDVCIANVTVDVWPVYKIELVSDIPGRLLAYADMPDPDDIAYSIQVEDCFPFCDKIGDEAVARVKSEIESNRHQAFPFADLRDYAIRIQGRFDPYGVLVMMEPTT